MALSDDLETWPPMLQKILKWNEALVIMPWIPCLYGWAVCAAVDGFMDCTEEFNHKLPSGYCDGTEKKFPLDVALMLAIFGICLVFTVLLMTDGKANASQ